MSVLLSSALCNTAAFADDDARPCCRDHPRWYAAVSAQAPFLQPTEIEHPSAGFPANDEQSYSIGYGFSGAVGYMIYSGVRIEMELAYRSNNINKDPAASNQADVKKARQRSFALMANGYVDLHNDSDFTPYIGAGVGPANVTNPRFYDLGGGVITDKISGWTVAYQFMAGLAYKFEAGNKPFAVNLGYRYFTGQDLSTKLKNVNGEFSIPNDSHNVELGARLYF